MSLGGIYRAVTPLKHNKKKQAACRLLATSYNFLKKDGSSVKAASTYGYVFSKKSAKTFNKLGYMFYSYDNYKLKKKYKLLL